MGGGLMQLSPMVLKMSILQVTHRSHSGRFVTAATLTSLWNQLNKIQ